MTNRERMESLTDEELARFLTIGILVTGYNTVYPISLSDIARGYTDSEKGIAKWLSNQKQYEIKM